MSHTLKNSRTSLVHVPKFFLFFYFWDEKIFFPGPPQNLLLFEGYLHTLDHRRSKNVNYFPYIFENVTFGSTKPKKYIFENIGKIIHEKDRKFLKTMPHFLKNFGHNPMFFPYIFKYVFFRFCRSKSYIFKNIGKKIHVFDRVVI